MKNIINKSKEIIKKYKVAFVLVIILTLITVLFLTSYAYWRISKKQNDVNEMVAACIDISFVDNGTAASVNLLNEWPIEDETALNDYDGYDFYVKNNCNAEVTFFLASEKITPDNESIKDSSISMAITSDSNSITSTYSSLTDTDPVSSDAHKAKIIKYETLAANEKKEYNYKMWINTSSTREDTEKHFKTRLFVTTYQGLVDPEIAMYSEGCFRINGNGLLTGYYIDKTDLDGNACVWDSTQIQASDHYNREKLVADISIPQKVAGIDVKSTDISSFEGLSENNFEILIYLTNDDDEIWVIPNKNDSIYEMMFKLEGYESIEEAEIGIGMTYEKIKEEFDMYYPESYDGEYKKVTKSSFISCIMGELQLASLDLSKASKMTNIGYASFKNLWGYDTELEIPANIKTIEDEAFVNFMGSNLTLHEGLEKIGNYAFGDFRESEYGDEYGYVGTGKTLTIPDSVKSIGAYAFYPFEGTFLDLGDGLESLGQMAFGRYTGTGQTLTIPSSLKEYPEFKDTGESKYQFLAFNGSNLVIEDGVEAITTQMFGSYKGIGTNLVIPGSVKKIDLSAFLNYIGDSLTLENGILYIGDLAFTNYKGANQNLIIPNSVKSIGNSAFSYFNGSSITIGNNVETIGKGAFSWFNGSKVTLGNNIKTIGENAFDKYVGTDQELIIPDSVQSIGSYAFHTYNGSKLILGNDLEDIGMNAFFSYNGIDQSLIIPNRVELIRAGAFGTYNGSKLVLGNSVKGIGEGAFRSYVGTGEDLIIPNSVNSIGMSSFSGFKGASLKLSNGLNYVHTSAFWLYTGIINVNRTETEWNNAVSDGSLVLERDWKNSSATLVYN